MAAVCRAFGPKFARCHHGIRAAAPGHAALRTAFSRFHDGKDCKGKIFLFWGNVKSVRLYKAAAGITILHLDLHENVINEGHRHRGLSALVDLVARK